MQGVNLVKKIEKFLICILQGDCAGFIRIQKLVFIKN